MMGTSSAVDWRLFAAVLFGLLMFGVGYSILVQRMGRYKEGFVSLLVVVGVGVTLIGVALISWQAALITVLCFAASGLPMVIGDVWEYIRRREQDRIAAQEQIERLGRAIQEELHQ